MSYSASNHFGNLLRSARKQKASSQDTIAEKLGVTQAYVAQMEKGVRVPGNIEILKKLSKVLGLDLNLLQRVAREAQDERALEISPRLHSPEGQARMWRYFFGLMNNLHLSDRDAAYLWKHYWNILDDESLTELFASGPLQYVDTSTLIFNVLFTLRGNPEIRHADVEAAFQNFAGQDLMEDTAKGLVRQAIIKSLLLLFPTVTELLHINREVLDASPIRESCGWNPRYGGSAKAEAIIGNMKAGVVDREFYPSALEKTAVLVRGIAQGHPFKHGNKRTALVAGIRFLEVNANSTLSDSEDLARTILIMQTDRDFPLDNLIEFLRDNFKPLDKAMLSKDDAGRYRDQQPRDKEVRENPYASEYIQAIITRLPIAMKILQEAA